MTSYDYDLFTIGAGSGGVRASRLASAAGAKVAVAEEYRVGGTCVIRGCVPKKLFVYASKFSGAFKDAGGFGWNVGSNDFEWSTLLANKDQEIDRLNKIYIKNLNAAGVEIIDQRAELIDNHTIKLVGDDRIVTAKHILIATGATPFVPQIKGAEHAITSNEAFHLTSLPNDIIVVGGGYIAVEFAGIFNGLGVKTTLVYRGEQILRGFDDDVRNHLANEMVKKGIDIKLGANIAEIFPDQQGFTAKFDDGSIQQTGLIMYSTGRVPKIDGLGLENAGVETSRNGAVVVDAYSKTTVDNIYAVGDVTDRAALTPVAIREGAAFVDTVYHNKPTAVDHSLIPTAVFSQPEIGTVGLPEAEAKDKFDHLHIYKSSFRAMKHTLSGSDEKMLMKLIVDGDSDKVLGCHVVGDDAGEMIQMIGVALNMGATKADFDATIAVHPTAAEELVTMKEPTEIYKK